MRSLLSSVVLAVSLFVGADVAAAATLVVGFDDLPPGAIQGEAVPSGYGGLDWSNFYYLNSVVHGWGYAVGAVSPPIVAFNGGFHSPASISKDVPFDANSVYLTAAFNHGLQVQVDGFLGATLIYTNTYTVDSDYATFVALEYLGVDRVVFTSFGGTAGTVFNEDFVMDDLTFSVAPEPAAVVLMALALVGVTLSPSRVRKALTTRD